MTRPHLEERVERKLPRSRPATATKQQRRTRLPRLLRTSRGAGFDLFDLPRFFAEGTGTSRSARATFVRQAQL